MGRPAFGQENNTVGMFKVVNGTSEAVRTPVKTGARWGDNVAILDGLKSGERVMSAGQVKVQNGAQVKIGSPAPAPPVNPTLN